MGVKKGVVLWITSVKTLTRKPLRHYFSSFFVLEKRLVEVLLAEVRVKSFIFFISHSFYWLHVFARIQLRHRWTLAKCMYGLACRSNRSIFSSSREKLHKISAITSVKKATKKNPQGLLQANGFMINKMYISFCQTLCLFVRTPLVQDVKRPHWSMTNHTKL